MSGQLPDLGSRNTCKFLQLFKKWNLLSNCLVAQSPPSDGETASISVIAYLPVMLRRHQSSAAGWREFINDTLS
jgi:hypothetical protein